MLIYVLFFSTQAHSSQSITVDYKSTNKAVTEMPTFGRPFQLGMLYDATRDKLIQCKELWNQETLRKATQDERYLDTDIILDDSLANKCRQLSANSATLKVNLLTGLTHVSGAAKFLTDHKSSSDTVRVSIQFKYSSHTQEVNIHQLGQIQNQAAIGAIKATHVVSKILFGLKTFLVIDCPHSVEESTTVIQQKMTDSAQFLATLYESEKSDLVGIDLEEVKKYSCKFYSDAPLPTTSPFTFEEVVVTLKKYVFKYFTQGSNCSCLVPIKVWLYPLCELDSSAPSIVQNISVDIASQIEKIVDDLNQAEMRVMQAYSTIPCFQEQQTRLVRLIKLFYSYMTEHLSHMIPNIRNGSIENDQLISFIRQIGVSPFTSSNLTFLVNNIELEIKAVSTLLKSLCSDSVKYISSDEVDALAIDFDYILSFELKLGGTNTTYLHEMDEYLRNKDVCEQLSSKVMPWYKDASKKRAIQIKAKIFKEFALINSTRNDITTVVHVSDAPLPSKEGVAVVLYADDEPTEFDLPSKPLKLHITKDDRKEVHLAWSEPKYGINNVTSYIVSFHLVNNTSEEKITKTLFKSIAIQDLAPELEYEFTVQAECIAGLSPKSDIVLRKPAKQQPLFALTKPAKEQSLLALSMQQKSADVKTSEEKSYNVALSTPAVTSTEPTVLPDHLNAQKLHSFDPVELTQSSTTGQAEEPLVFARGMFEKPQVRNITCKSITLEWKKPSIGKNSVRYYSVLYQADKSSEGTFREKKTNGPEECITVDSLYCMTSYIFRIQATFSSGLKLESEPTEAIQTTAHITETVRLKSKLVSKKTALKPAIYELTKTQKMISKQKKIAKYEVGEPIQRGKVKVLMVVGATGAGKTTLINGLANYMYGVQWEDDFRFVLFANEPTKKSQAHSQTSWITAYTLYRGEGSPVPYSLTIIDTPGFGDTEGVTRDKEIARQIKDFFSVHPPAGIDILHGIGFVTQSALARLTPTQQYIFDSILSIYGKDIAGNIFMMTTFADSQDPPVMEAIKAAEVPYQKYFKFNNSALFVSGTEDSFDAKFWKMGFESFLNFFLEFGRAQHRSLQLTRDVLDEREQLENVLKELQPQIYAGLTKMNELQSVKTLAQYNEQSEDFFIRVPVTKQRKVDTPPSQYTTNCLNCKYTCHDNCDFVNHDDKKYCCAMDNNGSCKVCPGKCLWSEHQHNPYIFELYEDEEEISFAQLKEQYAKEESGIELMIANIEDELNTLEIIVLELVSRARRSVIKLDEIALKPNPLSEVDYIDQLIISEEQNGKVGWQKRIKAYKALRKRAELMHKIKDHDQVESESLFSYLGGNKAVGSSDRAPIEHLRMPTTEKKITQYRYLFWKT